MHLTSPAASAGRRYISSTTLWATFPWMNCYKRNRHDRNHACSTKFEFYCLTSREHMPSAFSVQSAETYRKEGKPLFPGAWEKRRLLCSASREKKGACVNSRHTRSQIEDNHQRATGRVDVPRPKTTSAIRIEQQRLFCSCRTAGQTAPQRGADIKIQIRLNKIKILFNRVEARLDFFQNCGIMNEWQSAQLSGGLDSLFHVSI